MVKNSLESREEQYCNVDKISQLYQYALITWLPPEEESPGRAERQRVGSPEKEAHEEAKKLTKLRRLRSLYCYAGLQLKNWFNDQSIGCSGGGNSAFAGSRNFFGGGAQPSEEEDVFAENPMRFADKKSELIFYGGDGDIGEGAEDLGARPKMRPLDQAGYMVQVQQPPSKLFQTMAGVTVFKWRDYLIRGDREELDFRIFYDRMKGNLLFNMSDVLAQDQDIETVQLDSGRVARIPNSRARSMDAVERAAAKAVATPLSRLYPCGSLAMGLPGFFCI